MKVKANIDINIQVEYDSKDEECPVCLYTRDMDDFDESIPVACPLCGSTNNEEQNFEHFTHICFDCGARFE